jgi:hypothetical protein
VDQVIADELAPGADHADCLGHRALPVSHVVEHHERQHDIKAAIRGSPWSDHGSTTQRARAPYGRLVQKALASGGILSIETIVAG